MQSDTECALHKLAADISSHHDWWIFPSETSVRGFMGTGPVFLVGDQPSTSEWPESHPNRRLFYDTIAGLGLGNAHITDLYKRRGSSGGLRVRLPEEFSEHLALFRKEVDLLRPTHIVAMGALAQELIWKHLVDLRPRVRGIWHFAYVTRCSGDERAERERAYIEQIQEAIRAPLV